MSARHALALLLPAAACTTFEAEPPPRDEPDVAASAVVRRGGDHPDTLEDTAPCATPPLGPLESTSRHRTGSYSSGNVDQAKVTWTVEDTVGCVDHYVPSGGSLRAFHWWPDCDMITTPATGVPDAGDGELRVDRSTSPPTFLLRGHGSYLAAQHCRDEPAPAVPDEVAVFHGRFGGSFDGGLVAGSTIDVSNELNYDQWSLRRVDAVFTPPAPGTCSEPPTDAWAMTASVDEIEAEVNWTRVSTTGCVDTFQPSGTARWIPVATYFGSCAASPASGPVGAMDGTMTIDRSTDPPTMRVAGRVHWAGTVTCTRPDGSTWQPSDSGWVSGDFVELHAAFDGDRFGGEYQPYRHHYRWHLERL